MTPTQQSSIEQDRNDSNQAKGSTKEAIWVVEDVYVVGDSEEGHHLVPAFLGPPTG